MNLHNIAIIFAPNLFRPFEFTPNDLIYAGQLVEVLKMMLENYMWLFDVSGDELHELSLDNI